MTETTSQLPPCPLPDCEGGEHHYHDVETYAAERDEGHDCAWAAKHLGYRCYGPSIPQWQPIEHDRIKAGMRIRATIPHEERTSIYIGVAHHWGRDSDWCTEGGWLLTGWDAPVIYEVDLATIPDPDAELIELIGKAMYAADEPGDEWGEDGTEDVYRKLARAALTVIRESAATA